MWAKRKQHGFTIVELLIVIVVIGILAAISIAAYTGVQGRAQDARRVQDLQSIAKALELYKISVGGYPGPMSTPNASGWEVSTTGTTATNFLSALKTSGTVSSVPVDPINTGNPTAIGPGYNGTNQLYFYYRYPAGQAGCDLSRGEFYILGVTRMDMVPSGQTAPNSPGFSCPERNWSTEGAWVTGGYTN